MRILIVDDHAIVRMGLQQVLAEAFAPHLVCDEAASCQEALGMVVQNDYDLVLLDISLPDRSGLEVLGRLKEKRSQLPVLIVSMHPEHQYAIRALKLGASGYLTKNTAPGELVTAVEKVLDGGTYVGAGLSQLLAAQLSAGRNTDALPHESLSNRELQVACLIASGKSVGTIADNLCLSEKTVGTYRLRLLAKLGVKNSAELTAYCLRHGLIA